MEVVLLSICDFVYSYKPNVIKPSLYSFITKPVLSLVTLIGLRLNMLSK